MPELVVMTRMNLTMETGLLAGWYKKLGEAVAQGEVLCSVENEKETEDLLAPMAGVVAYIWAQDGEKYAVGTPLCLIALAGEDVSAAIAQVEGQRAAQSTAVEAAATEAAAPAASAFRILPKARAYARQNGVTVEELQAHFGLIAITEKHIDEYKEKKSAGTRPAQSLGSGRRVKLTTMRRAIADNMTLSAARTARLTNFMEVDMTAALQRLAGAKKQGRGLSVTALVIKACAAALVEHEVINTVFDEAAGEILYRDEINIGFAVDISGGLVVPVIQGAGQKTAEEITAAIAALAQSALEGRLTAQDSAGGTFTVSNVGMLGIDSFTPIIRYPETAILGIGQIKTLPRYLGDDYTQVVPRKIMKIGLTYDHRVIDGAPASRFMQSVRATLESPDTLN